MAASVRQLNSQGSDVMVVASDGLTLTTLFSFCVSADLSFHSLLLTISSKNK